MALGLRFRQGRVKLQAERGEVFVLGVGPDLGERQQLPDRRIVPLLEVFHLEGLEDGVAARGRLAGKLLEQAFLFGVVLGLREQDEIFEVLGFLRGEAEHLRELRHARRAQAGPPGENILEEAGRSRAHGLGDITLGEVLVEGLLGIVRLAQEIPRVQELENRNGGGACGRCHGFTGGVCPYIRPGRTGARGLGGKNV